MDAWRHYWQQYGVGYGLFQAFMVGVWVTSGIGLTLGVLWLYWDASR